MSLEILQPFDILSLRQTLMAILQKSLFYGFKIIHNDPIENRTHTYISKQRKVEEFKGFGYDMVRGVR